MKTAELVLAGVAAWLVCRLLWWVFNDWYFGGIDDISLDADELAMVDRCVAAHPAGARWREDRDVTSSRPLESRGGGAA